jgi:GT2 family glycosyltransferase
LTFAGAHRPHLVAAVQVPHLTADEPVVTVPARTPLCVVPVHLRTLEDLELVLRCLVSLWSTAGSSADVLIVDDATPTAALQAQLAAAAAELDFALIRRDTRGGFAKAANVGLIEARTQHRDAVLLSADVELVDPTWLATLLARTDTHGRPAAVVGARLLYPNGLLQHAGYFFSQLSREWWHRYQYGPADLPEALQPCRCPVSTTLALIRYEALSAVGLLDEELPLAWEDVDYCLRTFAAGLECVYEPAAVAVHAEQSLAGRRDAQAAAWTEAGLAHLHGKWARADLSDYVPAAL